MSESDPNDPKSRLVLLKRRTKLNYSSNEPKAPPPPSEHAEKAANFKATFENQSIFNNRIVGNSNSAASIERNNIETHQIIPVQQKLVKNEAPAAPTIAVQPIEEQEEVAARNAVVWTCGECNNDCIPVIRESRCICGHRLKEHDDSNRNSMPCKSRGCACSSFFFMVAEGAWIIRCRCKHKHIEHDCTSAQHICRKCTNCSGFDSPWVCNCGHPWKAHTQHFLQGQRVREDNGRAKRNFAVRHDGLLNHLNEG